MKWLNENPFKFFNPRELTNGRQPACIMKLIKGIYVAPFIQMTQRCSLSCNISGVKEAALNGALDAIRDSEFDCWRVSIGGDGIKCNIYMPIENPSQ